MICLLLMINFLSIIVHGDLLNEKEKNQDPWTLDRVQDKEDKVSRTWEEVQDKNGKPDWAQALSSALSSPDRTIDIASLGIDPAATFDRLLSPGGIINQFALSITIQLMFIVGYAVTGGSGNFAY